MTAAVTDNLDRVTDSTTGRPVIAALAAPGKAIAASSININDNTNWTTTTGIHFSIYTTTTIGGVVVKDPTSQTDWKGTLSGTTISNLTITGGTDRAYSAGAIVELTPTARYAKDLYDLIIAFANQNGTLKSSAVQAALSLGSDSLNGWNPLGFAPSTVAYSGNKFYTLTFTGTDVTGTISAGMRLRAIRTVTGPTQCTDLESSSSQYATKTSPSGLSFTDDYTLEAWIKPESYTTNAGIIGRGGGAGEWGMRINSNGQIEVFGLNAASNGRIGTSYRTIPLGVWTHVAATLDMSGSLCTMYINGAAIDTTVANLGAGASALVNTGDLKLGINTGSSDYFDGKISDARVWSVVRSAANIRDNMNQQLTGSETNLVAYFKLGGNFNDSTSNANNLTGQNSAVATNADTPFTNTLTGVTAGTTNYAEVVSAVFSVDTTVVVRVPDGDTLPTSGGITSVSYSTGERPYGWPGISKLLAYAQIGVTYSTTSTSPVQASGLVAVFTVPTSAKKYRITLWAPGLYNTVAASNTTMSVWDVTSAPGVGSALSGTQLAYSYGIQGGSSSSGATATAVVSLTPGQHTIVAGLRAGSNTAQLEAGPTGPAHVSIEEL